MSDVRFPVHDRLCRECNLRRRHVIEMEVVTGWLNLQHGTILYARDGAILEMHGMPVCTLESAVQDEVVLRGWQDDPLPG